MIELVVLAVLWVACGVVVYGAHLAFFQGEFPTIAEENYERDKRDAAWISALGPMALVSHIIFELATVGALFKHGLMYRKDDSSDTKVRNP